MTDNRRGAKGLASWRLAWNDQRMQRVRMGRRARVATIRDVARAANVGIATVSRAIAESGYVSDAVRQRVRAAIEQLGYTPSRAARTLRGGRRPAIGVLLPDLGIPVYVKWLRAAEEVAQRAGYILLICDARRSTDTARMQLQWLLEERVAGLLLAGQTGAEPALAGFHDAGIPVAPDLPPRPLRRSARHHAEHAATLAAFRHLVRRGHRRIAYLTIAWRGHAQPGALGRLRIACLRETLAAVGVEQPADLVQALEAAEDCTRVVPRLRRLGATAFVAGTGEVTAPLLLALHAAGLAIPDDASVLAFGESDWEVAHRPSISVVRHDYAGIAAALTRHLIARIENRSRVPRVALFPSELVLRDSIGRAPRVRSR